MLCSPFTCFIVCHILFKTLVTCSESSAKLVPCWNSNLHSEVKAELLEDLAAFGTDELQEAVEGLPGSTSTLQHLLLAHPSWKQRFYQLGGLEKILEKMEKTKKVFYHQRLAQCLCRILDMERVSRFNHAEIARRLVQQVLDVTTGVRFPLDANSDEARILDYMTLMEAIAQASVASKPQSS